MSEAQKKGGIGHKKLRADGYLYIYIFQITRNQAKMDISWNTFLLCRH